MLLDVENLDYFEFEEGRPLGVKGNLKKHIKFWEQISAPRFILNIIRDGYKLPFVVWPESVSIKKIINRPEHITNLSRRL